MSTSRPVRSCRCVQRRGHRLDELVLSGVGDPKRRNDSDGVLVHRGQHAFGVHAVGARPHGDLPLLDLPVDAELVPADLDRAADQVRLVGRLAEGLAPRLPAPFRGHAGQHAGLRRADGRGPDRVGVGGRVPEVGQHVHAADLDLGRLRVFGPVDHVLVDREVHQAVQLRLLPGLAERREVLPRVAIEVELVRDDLENVRRASLVRRKAVLRQRVLERGAQKIVSFRSDLRSLRDRSDMVSSPGA